MVAFVWIDICHPVGAAINIILENWWFSMTCSIRFNMKLHVLVVSSVFELILVETTSLSFIASLRISGYTTQSARELARQNRIGRDNSQSVGRIAWMGRLPYYYCQLLPCFLGEVSSFDVRRKRNSMSGSIVHIRIAMENFRTEKGTPIDRSIGVIRHGHDVSTAETW